ncbi:ComEC/Rec2 family competence protein [Clostridium amazonitimonense]|uniref:ComEC/Rec2 family competence protein n=1 Tax=Clostridium amazonitimonense TaxID=1499689 RepID=UPI0006911D9F|nr:ComEC/Rec2 family competence protein [Clostridium amazonitimonense]
MRKPLIYFFISFILGSVAFMIYDFKPFGAFIFIFMFIFLLNKDLNYKEVVLNFIIFLLSFYNMYSYFNLNLPQNHCKVSIRVVEKKNYYTIGSIKGKRVYLKNIKAENIGELIYARGTLKKVPQYERGIIGEFTLSSEEERKEDAYSKIIGYRYDIDEKFQNTFGSEEGALLSSLCFGDNSSLDLDRKEKLKALGVIHVISVSGFHIALIYKVASKVLGGYGALILTFFYGVFTGGKSSTWRAFIMILLSKISLKVYRNYDGSSALSLAGIILLMIKPYYILDIGFSLSFLATLGIILFQKRIDKTLYRLPSYLREPLSITLSAQIFSLPYMVFSFGTFNLGFILGNILLVPLFTMLILLGNLALILLNTPFISYIKYVVDILMKILNGGIHILHKLSPNTSYISYLQGLIIISIYICYFLVKRGKKRYAYLPLILSLSLVFQYYKPYTVVKYLNILGKESFIISYNNKNLIFTESKNLGEDIIKRYNINQVIKIEEYPINFKVLASNSIDIAINKSKNGEREMKIAMMPKKKSKLLSGIGYREEKNYDIILLKPKEQGYYKRIKEINKIVITPFNIYSFVID